MHESHDDPAKPTSWELEFVLKQIRLSEERQAERITALERRLGSTPPESVTVTSPTNWRIRAPAWVALVLAALVTLAVGAWSLRQLWSLH